MNISSVSSTSNTRRFVGLDAIPPDDEDAPGVEVGTALTSFNFGRGRGRGWFNESAISAKWIIIKGILRGKLDNFGKSIAGHAFVTGFEMT